MLIDYNFGLGMVVKTKIMVESLIRYDFGKTRRWRPYLRDDASIEVGQRLLDFLDALFLVPNLIQYLAYIRFPLEIEIRHQTNDN